MGLGSLMGLVEVGLVGVALVPVEVEAGPVEVPVEVEVRGPVLVEVGLVGVALVPVEVEAGPVEVPVEVGGPVGLVEAGPQAGLMGVEVGPVVLKAMLSLALLVQLASELDVAEAKAAPSARASP